MKNVTQLLATLCMMLTGATLAFGQNEIAQATTKNEKVIVDDGWAYFVTPKQLFTEKGTIEKVWITDIAPSVDTYTEEERQMQLQINKEFGKEFVLTYDHVPDNLEYTNDNFCKPVAERNIDNEEITPYTWKWVHLEMPEPGGGKMTANLRRPNWWLIDNKANKEGNWVKIEIEEMGINGLAQVKGVFPSWVDTRISDFKEEGKNKYRPITGWFERTAPEVWNYVFSTGDTIGSTPNHRFFSEDKQNYIAIEEINIGERIKLAGDKTAKLVSKWNRGAGQEKVYNIEVWRDHNFHVGVEGLLVHNTYAVLADFIAMTKQQKLDFIKTLWGESYYLTVWSSRKFAQSLIGHYKFTVAKGWTETGEFFPTIDFHSVSQKMGVSIKTTTKTNVQDFLQQSQVQDNIQKLIQGRQAGQFVQGNQTPLIVEKVQLSIIVPKENYSQTMVNQWKSAISTYVQQNFPGETLWVDIDFIEKHLN